MTRFSGKYPTGVLTPLSDLGLEDKIVTAGHDLYDHVLTLTGVKRFFQVMPININATHSMDVELVDGYYYLVSHYHQYHLGKAKPAFFIIPQARSLSLKTLDYCYANSNRKNLETTSGEISSYFNFHKGGINSDVSEGCWTMPPHLFSNFRKAFKDLEVIEVLKATSDPEYKGDAYDYLKKHVETFS